MKRMAENVNRLDAPNYIEERGEQNDLSESEIQENAEEFKTSKNCDDLKRLVSTSQLSIRKPSRNLDEIDKTLEQLNELAEDVYLTTSFVSDQARFMDKFLDKIQTETCTKDEDEVSGEVEEAVRDAEERQHDSNHVALNIDTECSSDEELENWRLGQFFQSDQDVSFNMADSGLSLRPPSNRRNRNYINSTHGLNDTSSFVGHQRARSNDSRSTSLFSSSVASFRRPMSHLSIDNSCFELNSNGLMQRSLTCTPIEKMFGKNSRSAPEMRIHETKQCTFPSSPSPSNDATTTTTPSEPSVSSEFSADPPNNLLAVGDLKLRINDGLSETVSPQDSPVVRLKNRKDKKTSKQSLKSSASSPNMNTKANDSCREKKFEKHNVRVSQNRSIHNVTIQIRKLQLKQRLKKPFYVMAKFDTKDVHRSPKMKSLGEGLLHEFTVETSDNFSNLHLIFLEGSKTKVARPVGKVTLSRKTIENESNLEHNLKLDAVSKYQEFCGQICIDLRRNSGSFSLRIVDCGGLKLKDKQSLLLLVSVIDSNNSDVGKLSIDAEERRSKDWLEMPCGGGMLSLKLTLWQDLLKGINSVFHGQVRVDVDETWDSGPAKWFYLRGNCKEAIEAVEHDEEIGNVLVTTTHHVDHILRMQVYRPLIEILYKSGNIRPLTASLVAVIESLPKVELSQVSRSLVELMAQTEHIRPVLNALYVNNILKCQDENTLFRGQSLAGKMLFEILTSFGKMYLITTLKPVIDKIFKDHKNCEIDPSRMLPNCNLEKNKSNLLIYFQMLFHRVTSSSTNCPYFIKQLFSDLRNVAAQHSGRSDVQRLAVSSFVIMRFFAAAMLNPKAFEIRKEQPDLRTSRTLLLLSKMLQRVSNCTVSQGPLSSKETWLVDVFENVTSEKHKQQMTEFLDKISLAGEYSEPEKSTVFKFGNLQQVDKSRLAWKRVLHYKKRYVQLTESHLIWQKDVQCAPKGSLKLNEIKVVSVDNKHLLTVETDQLQVQFEASGAVEANDWAFAIEKQRIRATQDSDDSPTEIFVFDVERHIDKIHNLFYKYRDTMTEWINLLEHNELFDEKNTSELLIAPYVPEAERDAHRKTLLETLRTTIQVTDGIQEAHIKYANEQALKNQMEEGPSECK